MRHVLQYYREHAVPEEIDNARLGAIGVAPTVAARVLFALTFLGLLYEDGSATPSFENLPFASDSEYEALISGLVRRAYEDAVARVDPSRATEQELLAAFHDYGPPAQRPRMVTLVLGLWQEAGLGVLAPPKNRPTSRRDSPARRQVVMPPSAPAATENAVLWSLFARLPTPGTPFSNEEKAAWLAAVQAALSFEYPNATSD